MVRQVTTPPVQSGSGTVKRLAACTDEIEPRLSASNADANAAFNFNDIVPSPLFGYDFLFPPLGRRNELIILPDTELVELAWE
jgi:hypothetical protein